MTNCPNCGAAPLKILENGIKKCPYCGTVIEPEVHRSVQTIYHHTIDEARIREVEHKEKKLKFVTRLVFTVITIIAILCGGYIVSSQRDTSRMIKNNFISAGKEKDYLGQDYHVVVAQLEARGFYNIQLVETNQQPVYYEANAVEGISVDGNKNFKEKTLYDSGTLILISYHPQAFVSAGKSNDYLGQNCQQVVSLLESKGFHDIQLVENSQNPVYYEANAVERIAIAGDDSFGAETIFDTTSTVTITYHPQSFISAGNYQDFIGVNYKTVVSQLDAMGFAHVELVDLNDAGPLSREPDLVESISVGGNSIFSSKDLFSSDSKVVVSYH